MRLTGMGKLVLLILIVGIALGGWRAWKGSQSVGSTSTATNGANETFGDRVGKAVKDIGSTFGKKDAASTTGVEATTGTVSPPGPQSGATTGGNSGDIEFIITAAKKDWVQEEVDRFNQSNGGKWRIVTKALPSREAMKAILSGQEKPVLWSPGSPIWPARLEEVWQKNHSGSSIVDLNDPNGYRLFLRSPLVFLTTKEKAKFLRPLLGGSKPWAALRELSLGRKRAPWGNFRFSHADPLTSSSGMLTLGLILVEYAEQTGQSGDLAALTRGDSKFITYLKELERGLVYDTLAEKGTTALTNAFIQDPSQYDLITAYESAALEAAVTHPNLAVIYPTPTASSEHAVSLLSGDWISPEQREGAMELLKFMGTQDSLRAGIKFNFRPAMRSTTLSLSGKLGQYRSQGFQQSFNDTELPSYEILNNAAYQWRINVVHKPPTGEDSL